MDDKNATQFLEVMTSGAIGADSGPAAPRYLIMLQGGIPGSMISLARGNLVIGRSDENDLILPEPSVSRCHAELRLDDAGRAWLTDLASTNGTFRNGERIAPSDPIQLHDGDRLRLGTRVVLKYACPDAEEEAFQRSMFERTVRDPLTGLYNRSYFLDQIGLLASRSLNRGLGLAIAMLDVDHFKSINDTLGHQGGDAVLRQVASMIRKSTRAEDLVARFGGEEFAIAIPIKSEDQAYHRAEAIRAALAARRVTFGKAKVRVTASLGIAFAPCCPAHEVDAMIASADRALYRAKGAGRNRVVRARDGRLDTPVSVVLDQRA